MVHPFQAHLVCFLIAKDYEVDHETKQICVPYSFAKRFYETSGVSPFYTSSIVIFPHHSSNHQSSSCTQMFCSTFE